MAQGAMSFSDGDKPALDRGDSVGFGDFRKVACDVFGRGSAFTSVAMISST